MIHFLLIIPLLAQDPIRLQYGSGETDRIPMAHHGSLEVKVEGNDTMQDYVRLSHEIFSLEGAFWKNEGFYSRRPDNRNVYETRKGSIHGVYDDEKFKHEFVASEPPKDLQKSKLLQILFYFSVGKRQYTLKQNGVYLSDDKKQEAWGEAMDLYINGVVRMPDLAVAVGESWTKEWTSTGKQKDSGGHFEFKQVSVLRKLENGVAVIESNLTGKIKIPPGKKKLDAEEAWTKCRGKMKVRFHLKSGRALSCDSEGKIIAYYRGADPGTGKKNHVKITFSVTGVWKERESY